MGSLVVQKYGGTSVQDIGRISNVARHVAATHAAGNGVVVAISAMGEQTDELLDLAGQLSTTPPRRELDMLLTAGERISAALLAIALAELKVPAISLTGSQCGILTDETHGNARIEKILGDRIRAALAQGQVVIVAGFQGMSPRSKEITTLGRGGTDLSAIALAAALDADCCELYKDVLGVYTADPRVVKTARLLPGLSFAAMTELAWAGASVLHPRGAHIGEKYSKDFVIRSSLELSKPGTLVSRGETDAPVTAPTIRVRETYMESPVVEAIAHKNGMAIVSCRVEGPDGTGTAVLGEALQWLWIHGDAPQCCRITEDEEGGRLSAVVRAALATDFLSQVEAFAKRAGGEMLAPRREIGLATITVVGSGFLQSPELVTQAARAVPKARLIEPRNNALVAVVREDVLTESLNALHKAFIDAGATERTTPA